MKITPEILRTGILKTLINAQELCEESKILLDNKKFARAYTLAHLAREEFSKCFILYRTFVTLILEEEIDWKKARKRYSNHRDKIITDRILSFHIVESLKSSEDKILPPNHFLRGINETNNFKNGSLYVNWSNENEFTLPSEIFNEEKASRTLKIAEFRIASFSKVFVDITSLDDENIARIKENISSISIAKKVKEIFKKFEEDSQ